MKHAARTQKPFRPHPLALEISRVFTATAIFAAVPLAIAAPQGGTVTAGQASIQHNGALTTITQGSQRAAIDWRSFNVGAAETVNFVQPNASSAILNRVVGNDPSAIFGRITANGQVLLINPNGILFGRTAQVDVGALTATTSNLSNADFMAGRLHFTEPGKPGAKVENQGRITVAEGGFAALVGRQVANSGVITARLGKVALAGGDAFVLDLYGDKLVNLIVDPAAMGALTDAQGQPLAARVDHSGEIVADGGRVQLSVATVKQLVDNLINLSGVVRATSFTQAQGVISLHGDANTRVNVSGTLDASGDRQGGRIEVTGRDVTLQSGASLAATGGQGSIAVGGEWQGRGTLAHADQVNVAQGATLDASGGTQGQGGTVVLWSDQRTQFDGRIAASGGSVRGDAGQVEVSSKGTLGFQGEVDVFAANGRQGSLLLDPLNLTIASTGSGDSQIAADQLRFFLARGASVNLSADNNVTVDAEVNGLVTGGGGVAGGGLTLTAGNNLTVNQNIVLNNGALNLTATGGTLTQADGTVLYTGSGAANLRGGAGVDLGQVLSGGAVDIRSANGGVTVRNALVAATPTGALASLASLDVDAAGPVSLNGAYVQGNATVRSRNADVALATALIQSHGGNVQVNAATGLASTGNNVGLMAQGTVTATAGQGLVLDAVLGNGQVELTSTGGAVTVRQAVTGTNGSSPAQGLDVSAAGAVTLGGANVGAGGIDISSSGNAVALNSGSLYSAGPVNITAQGSVVLGTGVGISTTGSSPVAITSRAGSITVGNGGINADGDGVDITLCAGLTGGTPPCRSGSGDINVNGDIKTNAGTISLSAPGGAVRVMATYAEQDAPVDASLPADVRAANRVANSAANATLDAGTDGARSRIDITAGSATADTGGVVVGEMIAYNGISLTSANGDVVLKRGLGGDARGTDGTYLNTGYVNYDQGYSGDVGRRPMVGSLTIEAGRSVELNGLNLDGNANPNDFINPGLSVSAGRYIVSNDKIAVNKGDIVLASRGTGETDGVYLGNSVYSRGHDVVANGVRSKTGYGIRISGRTLGLFDNTVEMAQLPVDAYPITVQSAQFLVDAAGFVVDDMGVRLRTAQGNYQMVGFGPGAGGRTVDDMRVYEVNAAGNEVASNIAIEGVRGVVGPPSDFSNIVATSQLVEIAKIEISNNVANYQDHQTGGTNPYDNRGRLVAPGQAVSGQNRDIVVGGGPTSMTLAGVAEATPRSTPATPQPYQPQTPIRISNFAPRLTSLRQAPIRSAPTDSTVRAATEGIGLKLLGFEETGDLSTTVWSPSIQLTRSGADFFSGMFFINFTGYPSQIQGNGYFSALAPALLVRTYEINGVLQPQDEVDINAVYRFQMNPPAENAVEMQATFRSLEFTGALPTTPLPLGARLVRDWTAVPLRPETEANISVATVRLIDNRGTSITPSIVHGSPGVAHGVDFRAAVYPSYVGASATTGLQSGGEVRPDYRLLTPHYVYHINTAGTPFLNHVFDDDTRPRSYQLTNILVDSRGTDSPFGSQAVGTRVFVYDGIIDSANGSRRTDSNSGAAIPTGPGIPGFNNSTVGFAGIGAGFDMVRGGATGNSVGGVSNPLGQSGLGSSVAVNDRSTQDSAAGGGVLAGNLAVGGGDGVTFSTRAAAQADLGRGGAMQGSAVNVFKKRYRLATAEPGTVCAPDIVQPVPGAAGGGCTPN
jgi:filamentous hemagglutinin family protein